MCNCTSLIRVYGNMNSRSLLFKKSLVVAPVLCGFGFFIAGCGGSGTPPVQGSLSGIVFDISGNPVRDASVFTRDSVGATTTSNSNGSYILDTVNGQNGTVYASVNVNGVQYVGQNFFQVFQGTQTKSTNITVVPQSSEATLSGSVTDRNGNNVGGVAVYAVSNKGYSSTSVLTDNNGNYTLNGLMPNVQYTVAASGFGYDNDQTTTTLNSNQNQTLDFQLSNPETVTLNPPANVVATAYTSPAEPTRSNDYQSALQNIKRITNPRYAKALSVGAIQSKQTRTTPQGNLTEIDVTWTPATDPALYGWGIYSAIGNSTNPNNLVAFDNDILSDLFADLEPSLQVGQTYTYGVTAINSLYGQTGGTESVLSNTSTCTVTGDLNLNNADPTGPTFYWQPASGCATYTVYLFDQYPSLGVNAIYTSSATSNTSLTYNGNGSLVSGQTYYYIVIGQDSGSDGESVSAVGSFVKS